MTLKHVLARTNFDIQKTGGIGKNKNKIKIKFKEKDVSHTFKAMTKTHAF